MTPPVASRRHDTGPPDQRLIANQPSHTAAGISAINAINVDMADPSLKDRIAELTAVRDQAQADAERATSAVERLAPRSRRTACGGSRSPRDASCGTKMKWRATVDEDGQYCFAVAL